MYSILLFLFCAIGSSLSGPAISLPLCKSADDACVTKAAKAAYPLILEENSEIGAKQLDPMFQELIEANLSILKLKLFNTTATGFKTCEVQNAKYDEAAEKLEVELHCQKFKLEGSYDVSGRLIVLPVEGMGDYVIATQKYALTVEVDLKTISKNGKNYKNIKSFKIRAEPLEKVTLDFKNLFNGQQDLAEAVLKFANENWKEVTYEVQDPIFIANFKKLVINANKYLKTLPLDEYTSA